MREKTRIGLIALLLCATVLLAGCTTNTKTNTSTSNNFTSTDRAQSPFLTVYVNALRDDVVELAAQQHMTLKIWEPQWVGGFVKIRYELSNSSLNSSHNVTLLQFKSINDASTFVKNKSSTYTLLNAKYESGSAYERVTGNKPEIFVTYSESGLSTSSTSITYNLIQLDNLVTFGDTTETR
jgi:outer membrane murein-binding lipoprotein Lpp